MAARPVVVARRRRSPRAHAVAPVAEGVRCGRCIHLLRHRQLGVAIHQVPRVLAAAGRRSVSAPSSAGRENLKQAKKDFQKSEEHVKASQSSGQIVGELLRHERFIIKSSSGPRYLVNCHTKLKVENLTTSTCVCLDTTSLTIMRILPREVDPLVFNMIHEDPGNVSFSAVGGLSDHIREIRETVELPIKNPELFIRLGIKPPKGVLLYGPPGTGKTLLVRALASNIDANFMKVQQVVSSAIIDKYIGESSRVIREMFAYARDHQAVTGEVEFSMFRTMHILIYTVISATVGISPWRMNGGGDTRRLSTS